ncbi:peroxisome proliferator-activated receptor gamma coactivator 1- hypothetical protein [Limosa lapponica baueri]|uniref:Peroxisome proliferator-activated receptor gamma coactivator 1-alpha n=1 Tax=Limosa lapponica baueri TaxID=1758121 RepID=A0A2I0TLJ4_LIMLA|nr:peroxisome proliferator-activated receptor gamma coactivator 1- hypothetical protein [Limosa lapponica baueri]
MGLTFFWSESAFPDLTEAGHLHPGFMVFKKGLVMKIDEESEANLLAVLTETLDSIPVDEDGLPSFDALTDGDVTNENAASPSPMPDGTPPTQEAEEPSLSSVVVPPSVTLLIPRVVGAKPTSLSLPLTPESPNDPKGSPFENKTIEQTLSVELSGTAGLTPPTTPPHKANQDNPFRTSPKPKSSCKTVVPPSKKPRYSESSGSQGNNPIKKGPEQSELYAQLSKTTVLSNGHEERKTKRPSLRLFGDHDYCQSVNSKSEIHIKISQELQDSRQLEFKDSSPGWQCQICSSLEQDQYFKKETLQTSKQGSHGNNRKQLQDQEIRAELNKHFGHPSQAVFDEEADKTRELELRDSDYSNEQFSKLPMFINSGLAMDGLFDDSEDESDKLCYPWDGTQAYSLFDVSPSCSSFNSPCRDSVSPPKSLFSQRSQRTRSRSRSFPQRRSCSRSPYSRSRSRSPCSRSSSRSCCYYESSHCRHRAYRSSPLRARSRSRSPYSRRPRYDSYEEYQHERLKREEYRKEYEKRESERAKQRERQRQKAICSLSRAHQNE